MSTAQFTTPLITVIPGQLISASLWNGEFVQLFNNINPSGVGAYSDTDPQMQTATDPFPSGTSRPTSMAGELERIRYILTLISGGTYWYNHPPINLTTLFTSTPVIPSGTVMLFFQAAAPTGWTQVVTNNDMALRVVSGTGGGTGGTNNMSTGLSHSHTVASHNHDLANHTHGMSHTHSTPSHQHQTDYSILANATISTAAGSDVASADSDGSFLGTTTSESAGSAGRKFKNQTQNSGSGTTGGSSTSVTDAPGTNTSGSASPATDTQAPTFKYIDVICCSKT